MIGGGGRDRTDDLKLAKLPLSQLSYAPTEIIIAKSAKVVGQGRFELPTSPLSGVRSNQLSYWPLKNSIRRRDTKTAVKWNVQDASLERR